MDDSTFFAQIEHTPVPWQGLTLHVPVFYPDFSYIAGSWLAPVERVRAILPSTRLHPYRVLPGRCLVSIAAYRYRQSDIGPYNEVSIGVPVTLDKSTPRFTGILRKPPRVLVSYSHHLPVSTEIARKVGAEFAGYPKFVADIDFTETEESLVCRLAVDGTDILTLRGRKIPVSLRSRAHVEPITTRNDYLLRSEFIISGSEVGVSKDAADIQLDLGDHAIADELRTLGLGRLAQYLYCPQTRGILTPVIESYSTARG